MDFLQNLLDNSTAPALTAFLLGLLTAISPCPLATNISAIGYISKDIENRRRIFRNGILYTAGRIIAYTVLGIVLISILKEGASVFGIQKSIGKWGELIIGPLLLLIGIFMMFGHKLNLPQFGFGGNGEGLAGKAAGEPCYSAFCLQWHSARQAAYFILVCSYRCLSLQAQAASCRSCSQLPPHCPYLQSHGYSRLALKRSENSMANCARYRNGST